ncbi:MAG TPA: cytochrome c oxidase subunit II [Gemmatimonadales bacterium]|nr:cytochrome c oxidase subunit II [Gemmatimonadales bacterium]
MTRRALPVLAGLAAACGGAPQSPLNPAGADARQIFTVGTAFFAIALVTYLVVNAVLVRALLRRRRAELPEVPDVAPAAEGERRLGGHVRNATILTAVILAIYVGVTWAVEASVTETTRESPVRIQVVGRQWWWEMRYQDSVPSQTFITANELHLPVGRPVLFTLQSEDVIHSFWIPALQGKKDLVPGKLNTVAFTPRETGTFRGQCAEFCGHQHAHMAFDVVVESPEAFDAWAAAQRTPAAPPTDSLRARGQQVFLAKSCPMCHNIQGVRTYGTRGPDLTHVASRKTLAAGALPNTKGHLAGWIIDPGRQKPGTKMPPNPMSGDELEALLAYLGGLR